MPRSTLRLAVVLALGAVVLALPAPAVADEDPPDPGKPFDQPVTPPPDPRLAANRGLWLGVHGGLFAALGGDRTPGGGGVLSGGWGFRNGLVIEGQTGAWYYRRPVGTDSSDDALAVPILVGARWRFVSLWRYRAVPYASAHLGPVITKAWYLGPTATKAGFGLQAAVGVQIPISTMWLIDCSFGYQLDAGGAPDAGTIMHRFGTGHAIVLGVGIAFHRPKREPFDPLGLRKVRPPAP